MKNICGFRNLTWQKLAKFLLCMLVLVAFGACNKKDETSINKVTTNNADTTKVGANEPDIIIDGTACSELGMIPNESTKGASNRKILIDALKNGTAILVDDKYYLSGTGNSTPVDRDIIIVGVTDNAEFTFNKSSMTQSNFIKVESSNFLMRKVKFTSMKGEPVYAFMPSGAHKMNVFAFEKCYFEGPIR